MSFAPGRIRAQINVAKKENWIDQLTGESPSVPRGFALDIEIGLFTNTESNASLQPMDFSGFTAVTVEIHDGSHKTRAAVATVGAGEFNIAMSAEDWIAQSAFNARATFSEQDMDLDLGAGSDQKTFWLYVWGIDGSGKRRHLGGTTMIVYETGATNFDPGPNQGGNLIPPGALYDGSGNYVVATTMDRKYSWTKSTNDASIVNGSDTYSSSQNFDAQGASVTLKGTPGALITATLRYPLYFTADEIMAIVNNLVANVRKPGQYDTYISKSSTWKLTVGIDDNGNKIFESEQL